MKTYKEITESIKPYVSRVGNAWEVLGASGKTIASFSDKEYGKTEARRAAENYLNKNFNKLKTEAVRDGDEISGVELSGINALQMTGGSTKGQGRWLWASVKNIEFGNGGKPVNGKLFEPSAPSTFDKNARAAVKWAKQNGISRIYLQT